MIHLHVVFSHQERTREATENDDSLQVCCNNRRPAYSVQRRTEHRITWRRRLSSKRCPMKFSWLFFGAPEVSIPSFARFLVLNQRFNGILIDRRLHLLTDFLCVDARASNASDYYASAEFTTLSRRLGSLKSDKDHETELRRSLERAGLLSYPGEISSSRRTVSIRPKSFSNGACQLD